MTYPVSAAHDWYITERGWFTNNFPDGVRRFTGCRFAILGTEAAALGFDVPRNRGPEGAPNICYELQRAGDSTPANGSTMRQGQKAVATVFPGADFLFGALTDDQFFAAVDNGAVVGFAIDCSKLPLYLKNFVGTGYNGGHYVSVHGVTDAAPSPVTQLFDPMDRRQDPRPRTAPYADYRKAILRDGQGRMIVSMVYRGVAVLRKQESQLLAQLDQLEDRAAAIEADRQALMSAVGDVAAKLSGKTAGVG